ncbi:hypothetical protein [Actinokineospora enzanensis]|uniref:hypothetical protein n=1 Tax=Actinokineospora enzanensis TaxID=155975 RepID=UPI000378749A|nr:hypothetical protein [Actinokineospora enzanensis]
MASAEVVLPVPALDRPVLADEFTASGYRLRPGTWWGLRPLAVGIVCGALLFYVADAIGPFSILLAGVTALYTATGIKWLRSSGAERRATTELLSTTAWRPARVEVLSTRKRRCVVEVVTEEQTFCLALVMYPAHRAVLRRSGRAWVVGPDCKGIAAVRIEGSFEAWPARLVAGRPEPMPVSARETADPTVQWAGIVRQGIVRLVIPLLAPLVAFGLVLDRLGHVDLPLDLVGAAAALVVGAAMLWPHRRLPAQWRLRGLLDVGEWTRATATVDRCTPNRVGVRDAVVTARLPEGGTVTLALAQVGMDLPNTVTATGALWIKGAPRPGGRVAVGFPGYPMVTVARVLGPA